MIDMLCAFALLASGNVANKYILQTMSPELLVGIRMSISGLLIILFSIRRSPRLRWSHIRSDLATLSLIALVSTLIPALLKAFALTYMAPSKQVLIGSIDPFITAFYAYLLFSEPITARQLLGIVVGCTGVVIAALTSTPYEKLWGEWGIFSFPECAVIMAVALGRYGWMVTQGLIRKERYRPHEITALSMLTSGILSLILGLLRGKTLIITGPVTPHFVTAVLYTTFIGNIAGYTLYSNCLRHHSSTIVSLTGLSMPLFVALMSWGVGLEPLSATFFIALAFLATGMAIFYSKPKKQAHA